MKIEFKENKTIVYLYRYHLSFDNLEKLNKEIKSIFLKLIKTYHLELMGYMKVEVYCNDIYGCVLEIESLYNELELETIDLKLVINDDCDFYFKTSDYSLLENKKIVYYDNKNFYINIKEFNDLIKIIEFGDIIYNFDKKNYQKLDFNNFKM